LWNSQTWLNAGAVEDKDAVDVFGDISADGNRLVESAINDDFIGDIDATGIVEITGIKNHYFVIHILATYITPSLERGGN